MLMAQTPEWKQLHQQLSGRLNSGDMAAVWWYFDGVETVGFGWSPELSHQNEIGREHLAYESDFAVKFKIETECIENIGHS